jgi:hypothetical protein
MDRRIYHGNIKPSDIAQALEATFNRGNFRAQTAGNAETLAVQIATTPGSRSGGQTAITVGLHAIEDGVMVELGEQSWLGVAASVGTTAASALFRPLQILGRLDDIAQDIESIQLNDHIWRVIEQATEAAGATHALSEQLSRLTCDYCGTANPVGEGSCLACGAPLGAGQPRACKKCGYVVAAEDTKCPNCGAALPNRSI